MNSTPIHATYLWIDNKKPTQTLRSKSRILPPSSKTTPNPDQIPTWGFDGSSTYQADGSNSDLMLSPVRCYPDPIMGYPHLLVLCEVSLPSGEPHPSNQRAALRHALDNGGSTQEPWIGFEQEYTMMQDNHPLGWPKGGFPEPQGPFYCGVGTDRVYGRELVEEHTKACLDTGLMLFGTNAEVMPGQWEFQIGYRSFPKESADPLRVSDDLWVARWLLHRLSEKYNITISLHPKPIKGDWNGAGCHTNFSTAATRDSNQGQAAITQAIERLEVNHQNHIEYYGAHLEERLTGDHETADISTFSSAESNRGSSIRIPMDVSKNGCGYIEDRRPGANCCPYVVSRLLVESICLTQKSQSISVY